MRVCEKCLSFFLFHKIVRICKGFLSFFLFNEILSEFVRFCENVLFLFDEIL